MSGRLSSLAVTLGVLALGAALSAVASYATDHSAEFPTLLVVVGLLAREANKWLDSRDWTRSRARRKLERSKP